MGFPVAEIFLAAEVRTPFRLLVTQGFSHMLGKLKPVADTILQWVQATLGFEMKLKGR